MNIGIIGGGAIGMLFAAYLGETFKVTLYVNRSEQEEDINSKGLILKEEKSNFNIRVNASADFKNIEENDLIIIAVKQYHLQDLYETINEIPPEIPLFFLQNGIGHLKLMESLPHHNLYVGTVEHGSIKHNDNTVVHKGKGKTNAAVFRGSIKPLVLLEKECTNFPFLIKSDYEVTLLEKLAVNAVINPLTAVLGVKNGQLIANSDFIELAQSVFNEILRVYPQLKPVITFNDIRTIGVITRENTSSMLADLKAGRETEIEAILGVMAEKAQEENIEITYIPMLYKMVKGLDKERGNK